MTAMPIKRSSVRPGQPAPAAIRAGDYVFTSTIYPIDSSGHAVSVDERLGEAGPALIAAQTKACVAHLKSILAEHGSSLGHVLKAEVALADASDFYEFKLAWRDAFPDEPPARTTIEVGDTFPYAGVRISLDVVALAGDSKLKRQVLSDPDGPDPRDAEAASWAVRAGPFVFCSGFTASDFTHGIQVGKATGFPNYGNDAAAQAAYFFDALNRVLGQAGTSLENAMESYLYEPDLSTFYDVDSAWGRYMPVPPGRASMGVKGLIVPRACFVASMTVLAPDAAHVKAESRKGIKYHPVNLKKVNYTPTLTAGPWIYIAGKTAGDMQSVHAAPSGLPHHTSDIEIQTRHVMNYLAEQMKANDTDWQHCHHVRVWLTQPRRDYRGFVRVWQEFFPDPSQAPVLAYVPATATMYPGPLIEIDPTCYRRDAAA